MSAASLPALSICQSPTVELALLRMRDRIDDDVQVAILFRPSTPNASTAPKRREASLFRILFPIERALLVTGALNCLVKPARHSRHSKIRKLRLRGTSS
jgi:hypothetical protein